jgi:hypothetical protein
MRHAELFCELSRTPVGAPARLFVKRRIDNPLDIVVSDRSWTTDARLVERECATNGVNGS